MSTGAPLPSGFREAPASGLIVPEAVSRERRSATREEWRLLDKFARVFGDLNIDVFLKCRHPKCKSEPMQRIRTADGGMTLRCNHRDLVFTKDY